MSALAISVSSSSTNETIVRSRTIDRRGISPDDEGGSKRMRFPHLVSTDPITERKFIFASSSVESVIHWLEHSCLDDPGYPAGVVTSLYLDTPDLCHFRQKANGDLLKEKVRVRWYDTGRCFVEVKTKTGSRRDKTRTEIALNAVLDDSGQVRESIDQTVLEALFELGYAPSRPLQPLLTIRYSRRRYIDQATGARIAVDSDIQCPRVFSQVFPGQAPISLPQGVLELKTSRRSVPAAVLRPLSRSLMPMAFSKYAECVQALLDPVGRRI